MLSVFAGREETMFAMLVQKYGPEPTAGDGGTSPFLVASHSTAPSFSAPDHRARLVRFYQHYSPDKVSNVDKKLAKYAGKEEAMFAALQKKYGPERPDQGAPFIRKYRSSSSFCALM